jgi:hypothetical protein
VLRRLIIVEIINVRQPNMQLVIPIPHKKHVLGEGLEVKIGKQERLKSLILRHSMPTPKRHVLHLEFLMPFPIER